MTDETNPDRLAAHCRDIAATPPNSRERIRAVCWAYAYLGENNGSPAKYDLIAQAAIFELLEPTNP